MVSFCAVSVARAMELSGRPAELEWAKLAELFSRETRV
jgi:hypothetical protein